MSLGSEYIKKSLKRIFYMYLEHRVHISATSVFSPLEEANGAPTNPSAESHATSRREKERGQTKEGSGKRKEG